MAKVDEITIEYEGIGYTIEIGRDYSKLCEDWKGEVPMTMDKTYRLDTAARILIGVLEEIE